MANQDQLEIIRADGQVLFYNLGSGITNIGRHPDNNIVLDTPGVAPFHAVLDHRRKPFHLVILSHQPPTYLGRQALPPNVSTPLQPWDRIQFDGHTLILIEAGAAEAETRPAPPTTRPEESPPAPVRPTDYRTFASVPPDRSNENIVVELAERTQTIEVDQSAIYQLTIVNGGQVVAAFDVDVEGINPEWVTISPSRVNLYEGERTIITITILPPRLPTSRAGMHPLAFVVTSPNYPRQSAQRGAMLHINPYYEFSVGELTPKRQYVSWFREVAETRLSVLNKGNSNATFRIEGQDDERACSFEFDVPGEAVGLARQADLSVMTEETISIPITITLNKRRLFGRRLTHPYTITTTLLEGQQTPRSLLGELRSSPLIGPWLMLLMGLLFIILIILFFWPSVNLIANPKAVTAGQEVTLHWNAFPPFFISVEVNEKPVEAPRDSLQERPIKTTTYEVTAHTWLSSLIPRLTGRDAETVVVTPVRPNITLFRAEPDEVTSGEPVILSWYVVGADELSLVDENSGTEQALTDPAGANRLTPEQDTAFTLRAINNSMVEDPIERTVQVRVTTPTPVPPRIDSFVVQPQVITAGQEVMVQWSVSGVDAVSINPLGEELPPSGPAVVDQPEETTLYVLTASKGDQKVSEVRQVTVVEAPTPTPTPEPGEPPVVELFAVTPEEWTRLETERDDEDNTITVQLNWVVKGQTTNIQLTGGPPGFEILNNLSKIGDVEVDVLDTTVFVLTAFNGETEVVETTQIKFLDPTPTPEPTEEPEPEPTEEPTPGPPEPEILTFMAEGVSESDEVTQTGSDPPTYEVVAGSNVNLVWETAEADSATLVGVGDQPPSGTYTLFNVVADQTYQLIASGEGGETEAFLEIRVTAKPAPPPPTNVEGEVDGSDVILTWEHSAENDITGFRIYRATSPNSAPSRVADESDLGNSARQWVDEGPLPTCTVYVVTAVYIDPQSGDKEETPASSNSWFSPGC